jgi:hypothetical protein
MRRPRELSPDVRFGSFIPIDVGPESNLGADRQAAK